MPVKRSRIGRSSSFGDSPDRPSNTRKALDSAKKTMKRSAMKEQSPARILTVSSPVPVMEKASVEVNTGAFFEKCYLCKKRILQGKDVFMFGYLRAFCSSECRDEQITMDTEMEKLSEGITDTLAEPGRMNNGKNLLGYQVEKHAAPQFQIS